MCECGKVKECPECWRRADAARPAKAKPAGPCTHRGEELSGRERQGRGLDHRRRWTLCLHPAQPLGEAVCRCKGCGPDCPGYAA